MGGNTFSSIIDSIEEGGKHKQKKNKKHENVSRYTQRGYAC